MKTSESVGEEDHHTETLRRQESVLLSAALVAQISNDLQVRVLFIKGPVAVQIGVRPPGDSSDIDVLVEPGKTASVARDLAERGWRQRSGTENRAHPVHSVTMYHPQWPSDIDIHFAFPGIEAPPETYFPLLWNHRQDFTLAARPVFGLDLTGATIMQALHSLRAPSRPKNSSELHRLFDGAPKPAWSEIYQLAEGIDALAALKPYLLAAYPEATGVDFPGVSAEWVQRTTVSVWGVHRLLQISSVPWSQRWSLIFKALFPPRRMLGDSSHSLDGASRTHVVWIRIRRCGSFLRALPLVVTEYLAVRRSQKQDGE